MPAGVQPEYSSSDAAAVSALCWRVDQWLAESPVSVASADAPSALSVTAGHSPVPGSDGSQSVHEVVDEPFWAWPLAEAS